MDLSRDEAHYSEYFEWKKKPFLRSFEELLQAAHEPMLVRLCRKVGDTLKTRA